MADEGAGLRRSALVMTRPPSLGVTHHCRGSGGALPKHVPRRSSQTASPERYVVS